MTPSLYSCTQQCLFCWRAQSGDLEVTWDEMKNPNKDTPEDIVEGCFKAQEKILTGYKGNEKTNWRKFQEAQRPKQVAISLTGEPTLYEPLGELIRTFHQKGLTTFLVSNGTLPSKLSKLSQEPTQLYISVMCSKRRSLQAGLSTPISRCLGKTERNIRFTAEFPLPNSDSHDFG